MIANPSLPSPSDWGCKKDADGKMDTTVIIMLYVQYMSNLLEKHFSASAVTSIMQ